MQQEIKINESHPSLIVLMLDQSGSMQEPYGGGKRGGAPIQSKAEAVAENANMLLMEIVDRCCQGTVYKHYFDIAVIGYSGKGVYTLLSDNRWFLSPAEMALTVKSKSRIMRKSKALDGSSILYYSNLKKWIEPYAEGVTPMHLALDRLCELVYTWQSTHIRYFATTIINITDGELTDANEEQLMAIRAKLDALASDNGAPTLINYHISSSSIEGVMFPTSIDELPKEAHLLYKLSSALPEIYNKQVAALKGDTDILDKVYRGITFNLPHGDFMRAIQIGSTTTEQIYL